MSTNQAVGASKSAKDLSPNLLLIHASLRDKYGLNGALREFVIEATRRQYARRHRSVLFGGKGLVSQKAVYLAADDLYKELDMWMEDFTAEHAPDEVKKVIIEERAIAIGGGLKYSGMMEEADEKTRVQGRTT